jgi:endonuclease-3
MERLADTRANTESPSPMQRPPLHGQCYPEQTGAIWRQSARTRIRTIGRVCGKLKLEYGSPRLGNPYDPLDDLIYIMLSNRTSLSAAVETYELLKREFPSWEQILHHPPMRLRILLKPIGLSSKRAQQIRSSLRKIKRDLGSCDLSALRQLGDHKLHTYLTSLPGVSEKVAKCVMLYTFDRQVLPVDTHVHRVSRRLGWVNRKRADQCHKELESLVAPRLRYDFHVDCVAHGKTICRASKPLCERCAIRRDCQFYQMQRSSDCQRRSQPES